MDIFNDVKGRLNNLFDGLTIGYDKSTNWMEYKLGPTVTHCDLCFKRQNKIYEKNNIPVLPEHARCLCSLQWMRKVLIGKATNLGVIGADYYIANYGIIQVLLLWNKEKR